ncbi:peptidyl-tRNA hydrolase [Streptomyces sp. N2-109]|uniref:peptidyl-tRNA hydrolase n=1 Tax=Streptomyces gossypii TaxID=2883101 RepID=A0ABT2JSJ7_9ACTN|nr:peptidyl-tRNA hydrolase [Streptomyces gossypii]MCT2590850.1 peptidyl-tRNA hydrolase [Streptomyces gossypii]
MNETGPTSAHAAPAPDPGPDPDPGGRDGDAPARTLYVLPLVVRIERAAPPARTDALETAARAVLTLLADPRTAAADGEWCERVRVWEERGIRKVVRRARGAEWRRAEALPGLTVTGRGAEVRVFPPVPLDAWPKDLARLQVSGTELADPEPGPGPAPRSETAPETAPVPVLWLNPELEMSAGKAMAQAGHGAQCAWWALDPGARADWLRAGFPLSVRAAESAERWARLTGSGLPLVQDAGFTEIAPGTCTVVADHPALRR